MRHPGSSPRPGRGSPPAGPRPRRPGSQSGASDQTWSEVPRPRSRGGERSGESWRGPTQENQVRSAGGGSRTGVILATAGTQNDRVGLDPATIAPMGMRQAYAVRLLNRQSAGDRLALLVAACGLAVYLLRAVPPLPPLDVSHDYVFYLRAATGLAHGSDIYAAFQ